MPKITLEILASITSIAVVFSALVAFIVSSDSKATYAHSRIDEVHERLVRIEHKIDRMLEQRIK